MTQKIMERRQALKILGALVVCLAGRATKVRGEDFILDSDNSTQKPYFDTGKVSVPGKIFISLYEKDISELIIYRVNGTKIVVSFSEIIDALGD